MLEKNKSLLVFIGVFDKKVTHSDLGVIHKGTISYEYYWLTRWYNVFRFYEPNGDFRNYYCNINMPPVFKNAVLDYVDLDIDIVIWKDFKIKTLDEDEYEKNSIKYKYPTNLKQNVYKNLIHLKSIIKNKEFPFDEKISNI